jgi:hypothetical protein
VGGYCSLHAFVIHVPVQVDMLRGGGKSRLRNVDFVVLRHIFLNNCELHCPEIWYADIRGFSVLTDFFTCLISEIIKLLNIFLSNMSEKITRNLFISTYRMVGF